MKKIFPPQSLHSQVVAIRGNIKGDPILVATGLVEPAAIAVFEVYGRIGGYGIDREP